MAKKIFQKIAKISLISLVFLGFSFSKQAFCSDTSRANSALQYHKRLLNSKHIGLGKYELVDKIGDEVSSDYNNIKHKVIAGIEAPTNNATIQEDYEKIQTANCPACNAAYRFLEGLLVSRQQQQQAVALQKQQEQQQQQAVALQRQQAALVEQQQAVALLKQQAVLAEQQKALELLKQALAQAQQQQSASLPVTTYSPNNSSNSPGMSTAGSGNLLSTIKSLKNTITQNDTEKKSLQEEIENFKKNEEKTTKELENLNKDKDGLCSTIDSLKKDQSNKEKEIEVLQEERDKLYSITAEGDKMTDIIKEMMKIIGIDTDDFVDCTGNVFAGKCLEKLKAEMGGL